MSPRKLLTAPQVARYCGTDLKTIHNWVNAGEIRHFRTPGRHLRFRVEDVLDFMQRYNYPIPEDFKGRTRRSVVVLDSDRSVLTGLRRSLGKSYEVTAFSCPVEALLAVGRQAPEVFVFEVRVPDIDGLRLLKRIAALKAPTKPAVVVYTDSQVSDRRCHEAGAAAVVRKTNVAALRDVVATLLPEQ